MNTQQYKCPNCGMPFFNKLGLDKHESLCFETSNLLFEPPKVRRISPWIYPAIQNVEIHNPHIVDAEMVIKLICDTLDVTYADLMSKSRKAHFVLARFASCFILRNGFKLTLTDIAKKLLIDHSTVIYAIRKVAIIAKQDETTYHKLYRCCMHTNTRLAKQLAGIVAAA